MNKKLIFPVLLIAMSALIVVAAPRVIQSQAEGKLNDLGFSNAVIGQTSVKLNGVTFSNVTLKRNITAKKIRIEGSPLHALGLLKVEKIDVSGLKIKQEARDIVNAIRTKEGISPIASLPSDIITVSDSAIIIPLEEQDSFDIDLSGQIEKKNNKSLVSLTLIASRATLDFNIDVNGFVAPQSSQLDATINSLNTSHKLASANRATGWLSYKQSNGNKPEIFGQVDAGSGSVSSIPTKNISAVIGEESDDYTLILRAQAAGIDGTELLSDITFGGSSNNIDMHTALNIKDTKAFFDYLNKINVKTKDIPSLQSIGETELTIDYLPEKRFVDGPLPFDIAIKGKELEQDILKGTFLIYPNDMTVRGNAQTGGEYTKDIQNLLSIPEEKVSDDTIRLDGSLKGLL